MNIIRRWIVGIVRSEAEKMLLDRKYINLLKDEIKNDTEQKKVNENDSYLESMRLNHDQ